MFLRREVPDHPADAAEQKDEADHAPDDRAARRAIADELFMRPVLRVGDVLAGPVGARGPRGPPEERGHLALLGRVGEGAGGNGVCIPAVAVDVGVVGGELLEGRGAIGIDHDRVRRRVVGVASRDFGEPLLQRGSRFSRQRSIV